MTALPVPTPLPPQSVLAWLDMAIAFWQAQGCLIRADYSRTTRTYTGFTAFDRHERVMATVSLKGVSRV